MPPTTTATAIADESSANLERWSERWTENRIGWHVEDDANGALVAHGDALLRRNNDDATSAGLLRVFLPLCGKARDMAYLSKHGSVGEVVGVDGIRKALTEFAAEHPTLQIKQQEDSGAYEVFKGNKITLLKGDFFHLTESDTGGKFDAVFDRGALVAIEPDMREAYVATMKHLIAPGGKILLVALEHEEGTGPPFSVMETEVQRLYQGQEWVASIQQLNPNETEVDEKGKLERFYIICAK